MTSHQPHDRPRRPILVPGLPEALHEAFDPFGELAEAQERADSTAAAVLAAGRRDEADLERLVALGDEVGLDALAALWSRSDAGSLPASLWALYALRAWVVGSPVEVARLASAGARLAEVSDSIAGLPPQPDPADVVRLVDDLLKGALHGDLPLSLDRAAALCRLVAAGRGAEDPADGGEDAGPDSESWTRAVLGVRLLHTADGLASAARAERDR